MKEFFRVVFMNSRDLFRPWWPLVWLSLIVIPILALLPSKAQGQEATATSQPAVRVVKMKVTAYDPGSCCCGEYADGKTSIGDNAYVCDGVAADPKLLPYRTRLEIPGVGIREVDDTGGAMRKAGRQNPPVYHIDLRFPTHEEALEWGVKRLDVKVLSPPEPRQRRVETPKPKGGQR